MTMRRNCPNVYHHRHSLKSQALSRRDFLKMIGASASGLFLTACGIHETAPTRTPTSFQPDTPMPSPTATETPPYPTATPETPTISPTPPPSTKVAITQAVRYDSQYVLQQARAALDSLGGISDIVHSGDRVAIKVNLTGGTLTPPMRGVPRIESYFTHPAVVLALGKLLRDAGAAHLYIVEATDTLDAFSDSGYEDVARELGAELVNLNSCEPYLDFYQAELGNQGLAYESFTLNPILDNIDVFVSVPKLKCHWCCGVTLSMKNSIGLVSLRYYRNRSRDGNRSAFHGRANTDDYKLRLPQVIMDLNRARPIDLVLIDGIQTVDGGEGPWCDLSVQHSHVLIAGNNAVATDAVGTAVMGFDPATEHPYSPFLHGWNHLNIAHALGFGSNHLEDIQVLGEKIEDVRCNFRPSI
jgi:uncharacterized protein (DUF362 family)